MVAVGDLVRIEHGRWECLIGRVASVIEVNDRGVILRLPSIIPGEMDDLWEFCLDAITVIDKSSAIRSDQV